MDRIDRMQLFARIVEGGSFVKAAAELGMARSTATQAIKALEQELGVRLLARTTRHVSPTPEGEEYHARVRAIIAEVDAAHSAFSADSPSGHLRIDAPSLLTRTFIVPRLPAFLARHPRITLQFGQGERLVDLVREGVDCALRAGEPEDSSLMMRRLGELPEITCASPAYIQTHGMPHSIDALEGHRMVGFVSSRTGKVMPLEFLVNGRLQTRMLPVAVSADSADTTADLARMGFGLIQAPRYRFAAELAQGDLVEVLSDVPPAPMPLNVLHPQDRQISRRLAVFLEWLKDVFADLS